MRLTERDFYLLQSLFNYGVLTTTQIKSLHFLKTSKSALLRRLNILEKNDFIKRVNSRHLENVWLLTHKGARSIGEKKSSKIYINENQLNHDLFLSELALKLKNNQVGENWQLEHRIRERILSQHGFRKKEALLLPDALFIINYKDQKEAVAMELELHRKEKNRYKKIFSKYRRKENILALWYVVLNKNLGFYLQKLWKKETRLYKNSPYFLFSLLEDVRKDIENARVYENKHSFLAHEVFKNSPTNKEKEQAKRKKNAS